MGSRFDYLHQLGGPYRPGWPYPEGDPPDLSAALSEVRDLFRLWYPRAGWWMRKDMEIETPTRAIRVLKAIRERADKHTWIRCMELTQWLSRHISKAS